MDAIEFNLADAIIKTEELIRKLSEEEKSTIREIQIIKEKMVGMSHLMNGDKHQNYIYTIEDLRKEICRLKQFPDCDHYGRRSIKGIKPPNPNIKQEGAESIQRSKSRFQHLSKNLATERKMGKELQQLEEQWKEQQTEVSPEDERNGYCIARWFSEFQPLPNKPLHKLMQLWVEEAENVGRLVLMDSKNMKETRKTKVNLRQLIQIGNQMYWKLNVGEAEFNKHWDSRKMRYIQNSIGINKIEFDLVKESRYHEEGRAKSELYREKVFKLRDRSSELYNELRRLMRDKSLATRDVLELQQKQAALATPGP